jgi:hypothetical protein
MLHEGLRVWVICKKHSNHALTGTIQINAGDHIFIKIDPPINSVIDMPSEVTKGLLWDFIDDPLLQMRANVEVMIDKEVLA